MNMSFITMNIKKEVWEYKKIFLWTPIIIAALLILGPLLAAALGEGSINNWQYQLERLAENQHDEMFSNIAFSMIFSLFSPFLMIVTIVQLYYFTACLYDERRDLSILFWRSLPVSDIHAISTKLIVGAIILPAFFLITATVLCLILAVLFFVGCAILSIGYDINLWGIWLSGDWISNLFMNWVLVIPYSLWMLPVFAWLMLASMYANKAPLLCAVLPIILVLLIESFVVSYFNLSEPFFTMMIADYFSLVDEASHFRQGNLNGLTTAPFMALTNKINIAGIILGCGMLYAVYWLRVNRSH